MKRSPTSVVTLEAFGRERLSPSFFMRDFLFSEIASVHGLLNAPKHPELALRAGRSLCMELLEPLQATFGRIAIRSAYRSEAVNEFGNRHGFNCGSNTSNYGAHIWDMRDKEGHAGAMACVVVPWFADRYEAGADWRAMAYWVHNHLPYSTLQFFPKLCAFNIGWSEKPQRAIRSYIKPAIEIANGSPPDEAYARWYDGFPAFART